jgi:anaerobic selenocysteine-containing dehydrogenase
VIAEIASRVLGEDSPVDWTSMKDTCSIRKAIGKVVPGFEAIGRIDETRQEFQIDGRTFHRPQFATENGRAQLHSHQLPELKGAGDELRLMTVRSEGQFNTVVYEEEDYYRGQDRRDVILVHPEDLASLGLEHDQLVSVQSETGQLDKIRVRAFAEIRQGNALMYFPEANVLVNRQVDAQSRTPAFKGVVVRVRAAVPGPSEMETSVD